RFIMCFLRGRTQPAKNYTQERPSRAAGHIDFLQTRVRRLRPYHAISTISRTRSPGPGARIVWRLRGNDSQVVGYREDSGNAVGTNVDQILIGLAVDDAFERNVPILHDDADRLLHPESVLLQRLVSIDGAVELESQTVIHGRRG